MSHQKLDYEGILRRSGHRVTQQRVTILDAVCMAEGNATLGRIAADVRRLDPTIALSTVYRTLKALAEVGIVVRQRAANGEMRYEIAHEH